MQQTNIVKKQTDKQADRQIGRHTDKQTDRQIDREAGSADRLADRQASRQACRQTYTEVSNFEAWKDSDFGNTHVQTLVELQRLALLCQLRPFQVNNLFLITARVQKSRRINFLFYFLLYLFLSLVLLAFENVKNKKQLILTYLFKEKVYIQNIFSDVLFWLYLIIL